MATNKDIIKEMALMEQRIDSMEEKLDKVVDKLDMLTEKVLDPDYGDITDAEEGNDLKVLYGKAPGASFPTTDIRPRPRKSVLCDDSAFRHLHN